MTTATPHKIQLVDPTGADPGPNPDAGRPARRHPGRGWPCWTTPRPTLILRAISDILNDEFEFSEVFYVKKHSASLPPKWR